jgi:RNA polymerase sigma factor (sigma-70 family)
VDAFSRRGSGLGENCYHLGDFPGGRRKNRVSVNAPDPDRAVQLKALCQGERRRKLIAFCRRRGVLDRWVEDVAQEVCLAAHTGLASFEGRNQAQLETWFFGIASNLCADWHKRRRFREVLATEADKVDSKTGVTTKIGRSEAGRQVDRAIQELSGFQQDLLRWRFNEGLMPAAIVSLLLRERSQTLTERQVSDRIYLALRSLSKTLGPHRESLMLALQR